MIFAPRSMLFVSGETPDRFDKALHSGADMICLDLEDAVKADGKAAARKAIVAYVQSSVEQPTRLAVRINALNTREGLNDVQALLTSLRQPDVLILPKTEFERDLSLIGKWFGDQCPGLVALIESPLGIENAATIAASARQGCSLQALMLGGADLSADLGCSFEWNSLLNARSRLVNAAKSCGLQAWDVPYVDVHNATALEDETRAIRQLGFDCKTAIHPRQIKTIHNAFSPTALETAWAEGVLNATRHQGNGTELGTGAFLYEGQMVDEPILRRARSIVSRAVSSASDDAQPPTMP